MKPLFYLANPYTHKEQFVMDYREACATKCAISLLKENIFVFSPISYNSPWGREGLPVEWSFWEVYDKVFLSRCDAMIVLTIEGWKKSVGVTAEIKYCEELGLPVFYKTLEQILADDVDDIKEFEAEYTIKKSGKKE